MELYDKDGDGFLAGGELDSVPGIKAALATIDLDKDGKATAEEIQARIESWQEQRYGMMGINASFALDGRPLVAADVVFEPESFLGDDIKAAIGVTSPTGSAMLSIPKEQRPSADSPPGVQLGLYRVRVSKKQGGKETLPVRYNVETTLGQQASPDDPAVAGQKVRFELKSK
jgi:hypothetical protein